MPDDDTPHFHGHRQRLRERFARAGAVGLADYELLELLLTYAVPRRDTKPLAKALLARFGSLAGVLEAQASDLAATEGLGERSAGLIELVRAFGLAYVAARAGSAGPAIAPAAATPAAASAAPTVHDPPAAYGPVDPAWVTLARTALAGRPEEALLVLYLDATGRLLGHAIVAVGGAERLAVSARQVVREALARQARGMIVAHNHPSGQLLPSADDLVTTHALRQAAGLLSIRLIDHLIVAPQGSYSLAAGGLLPSSG